jgi:hypothetical protein
VRIDGGTASAQKFVEAEGGDFSSFIDSLWFAKIPNMLIMRDLRLTPRS